MHFINFLLIFGLGLLLVMYREKVQRFTGSFAFAEKYLGAGGTYNFYLLLGIATMFFSFAYLFGTFDGLIHATVGRFFLTPTPQQ